MSPAAESGKGADVEDVVVVLESDDRLLATDRGTASYLLMPGSVPAKL